MTVEESIEETKLKENRNDNHSTDIDPGDGTSSEEEKTPACDSSHEQVDLAPHLEVLSLVGEGGMGKVYKVIDKNLNRVFAAKVLKLEYAEDAAAVKRFELEAQHAMQLSHPNVVSVYNCGYSEDGSPYLIMDFVEGTSLAQIVDEAKGLKPERVLKIVSQVCQGLAYLHEQSMVHRDIKPTNVLVSNAGSDNESVRIVDFGIAQLQLSANRETCDVTKTGEVFGSPHYMSPEQCLGLKLDKRSDIYSLGCLVYELITGKPPFEGSNPVQVVVKHINENPAQFGLSLKATSGIARNLEIVAFKCLEKDATDRYQSIDAIANDLALIGSGKQLPAYKGASLQGKKFTLSQTLGMVMAMIIGTPILFIAMSALIGLRSSALLSVICLASWGAQVLYGQARERINKIRNGQSTGRNYSLVFMSLVLCTLCGSALAAAASFLVFPSLFHMHSPVLLILSVWASILFFAFFISLMGLGWHGRNTTISGKRFAFRLTLLTVFAVGFIFVFFPDRCAYVSTRISYELRYAAPSVYQLYIEKFANNSPEAFYFYLDQMRKAAYTNDTESCRKLLRKCIKISQSHAELKRDLSRPIDHYWTGFETSQVIYHELVREFPENLRYRRSRAELFGHTAWRMPESPERHKLLLTAANDIELVARKDRLSFRYSQLTGLRMELHQYELALNAVNEFLHLLDQEQQRYKKQLHPLEPASPFETSAPRLIGATNGTIPSTNTDRLRGLIARAIIHEKLGKIELARRDYETLVKNVEPSRSPDKYVILAFANLKLGNQGEYESNRHLMKLLQFDNYRTLTDAIGIKELPVPLKPL